jgi:hypothetical protein
MGMITYSTGPVQHANTEIPQQKTAVISNTAESVGLLVTAPWIKCNSGDPRVVALASGNDSAFREGPDRNQVVLTSGHYVLTIG